MSPILYLYKPYKYQIAVNITDYDLSGRLIEALKNGTMPTGSYSIN